MSNMMLASAFAEHPGVGQPAYQRRQPQKTVLWQVVNQNLRTFQDATEESGGSLPRHVWQEFERYLACGDFLRGFARVHCPSCGYDRLVPFACLGRRSLCPSCCGRIMNETAAYWTDHLIGRVPVRHWTCTVPPPLSIFAGA